MIFSLIIPTFNESENISILIEQIDLTFSQANIKGEIIIIDDNSPDKTWEVADNLKQKFKNLTVLRRLNKKGLSSAVLDGFQVADSEIIGVIDADFSHPPEKIPELIKPILEGKSDFVIGSRYVEGGSIENWPLNRKIASYIARLFVKGLTDVKDPMSGFFFLNKKIMEDVNISPKGFKIGLELIVKGKYKKLTEVPITFKDRKYGNSKLGVNIILEDTIHIFKLYIHKLLKKIR